MRALRLAFFLSVSTTSGIALLPASALAQGGGMTPLAVDLGKVPVGSWAEYNITSNDMKGKLRWAVVEKAAAGIGIEMSMEGGITAMTGGQKTTTRMLLDHNPLGASNPVKRLIVQRGDSDPMELPADNPIVQAQKFAKPDPKHLVKKESIKVPGGSFTASHYKEDRGQATIEYWMNETVPPLGLVKMVGTPKVAGAGPKVVMELAAKGGDAKPTLTKTPKPMDPAMMMGAPPPSGGSDKPAPAPTKPAKK